MNSGIGTRATPNQCLDSFTRLHLFCFHFISDGILANLILVCNAIIGCHRIPIWCFLWQMEASADFRSAFFLEVMSDPCRSSLLLGIAGMCVWHIWSQLACTLYASASSISLSEVHFHSFLSFCPSVN